MKTHLQLLYYILTVKSLNVVGQTPFSVVQYPSSASLLMATLTASNQLPPSLHVGHLSYGFLGGGSGVHQGYEWIPKVNGFQEKLRNGWKSSDASAIFSYLQLSSAIFSYLQPSSAIFSHLQLSSAIFSHLQLSSAIFSHLQLQSVNILQTKNLKKPGSNRSKLPSHVSSFFGAPHPAPTPKTPRPRQLLSPAICPTHWI